MWGPAPAILTFCQPFQPLQSKTITLVPFGTMYTWPAKTSAVISRRVDSSEPDEVLNSSSASFEVKTNTLSLLPLSRTRQVFPVPQLASPAAAYGWGADRVESAWLGVAVPDLLSQQGLSAKYRVAANQTARKSDRRSQEALDHRPAAGSDQEVAGSKCKLIPIHSHRSRPSLPALSPARAPPALAPPSSHISAKLFTTQ